MSICMFYFAIFLFFTVLSFIGSLIFMAMTYLVSIEYELISFNSSII